MAQGRRRVRAALGRVDIQGRPACEWQLLRFRCSRILSTLRSGSRKPPFSARPDLNLNMPCRRAFEVSSEVRPQPGSAGQNPPAGDRGNTDRVR
ncbi:MAG: hypothetical protein EOQ42_31635 [Mesorhizobium sp.]|nr:MAG: hypothetical protein EOQ43_15950 [Mesorhizobium sp.]TGT99496.1 hypothetical protein EN807_06190 [Mesorhizobium sp. M5C.F.Ca.ET.164.01.1.1]RWB36571.1 MAG: hypothetical protein EOQ42_31635 [Mesorhizobium sp.]RWC17509.1 MAG: hypothetical protein EOS51_17790 [Mesorhizobium sp.]RWD20335.1 MAG: hypothetical protein EOS57_09525 [Mesorhizobium sp.]